MRREEREGWGEMVVRRKGEEKGGEWEGMVVRRKGEEKGGTCKVDTAIIPSHCDAGCLRESLCTLFLHTIPTLLWVQGGHGTQGEGVARHRVQCKEILQSFQLGIAYEPRPRAPPPPKSSHLNERDTPLPAHTLLRKDKVL